MTNPRAVIRAAKALLKEQGIDRAVVRDIDDALVMLLDPGSFPCEGAEIVASASSTEAGGFLE